MTPEEYNERWPTDDKLAVRYLTIKKDDENGFLGEGKYTGAYLDQVFLNKRAGHFMLYLLTYLGSIHLASPTNMFNLKRKPPGRGDVLIHRWKKQGVGHTMLVMTADTLLSGQMNVEVASGSMPRRQPKWEDAGSSKYRFTTPKAGGPGISEDGYAFSLPGWRHQAMALSQGIGWSILQCGGRPGCHHLYPLLGPRGSRRQGDDFRGSSRGTAPEEKRDVLLDMIEAERAHLSKYPASCAARIRREQAFTELYAHQATFFDQSQEDVDQEYRIFEDFVFAELVYEESRTCCWNSTNGAMYQAIVEFARIEDGGRGYLHTAAGVQNGGWGVRRLSGTCRKYGCHLASVDSGRVLSAGRHCAHRYGNRHRRGVLCPGLGVHCGSGQSGM